MHVRLFCYLLSVLSLSLMLTACGGGGGGKSKPPTVTSSSSSLISSSSSSSDLGFQLEGLQNLLIGESIRNGISGQYKEVISYEIEDSQIASIDENGTVTAISSGLTRVNAKLKDLMGSLIVLSYDVKVLAKKIPIDMWAGTRNTSITFSEYVEGAELYNVDSDGCDFLNYQQCSQGSYEILTAPQLTNNLINLNRSSHLVLKHGDKFAHLDFNPHKFPSGAGLKLAVFNDQIFVVGGQGFGKYNNSIYSSSDGIAWKNVTYPSNVFARQNHTLTTFNNRLWIIGGDAIFDGHKNDIWSSSDAKEWSKITENATFPKRYRHQTITFKNRIWVIGGIGENGLSLTDIWSSADGSNWENVTKSVSFLNDELQGAIVYNDKIWILVKNGHRFTLWASLNGESWQNAGVVPFEKSGFYWANYQLVVKDSELWMIGTGDQDNDALAFSEKTGWRQISTTVGYGVRIDADIINYKNKIFAIGGNDFSGRSTNDVWVTADGQDWHELDSGPEIQARRGHQLTEYNSRLFIIGGWVDNFPVGSNWSNHETSDIWSSENGIKWQRHTKRAEFPERSEHRVVKFNNLLWLIGGSDDHILFNDIWSSTDGINWNEKVKSANFSKRSSPAIVEFDNELWLLGGFDGKYKNDIWSSKNGSDWTLRNSSAAFSPRHNHQVFTTGNKLVLIGGADSEDVLNDIWTSSDGVSWELVTAQAPFSPRRGFKLGKLGAHWFIVGGLTSSSTSNEVWQSQNGTTWSLIKSEQAFSKRTDTALVEHDGKLFLLGGIDEGTLLRDIWSSSDGINWRKGYSYEFIFSQ